MPGLFSIIDNMFHLTKANPGNPLNTTFGFIGDTIRDAIPNAKNNINAIFHQNVDNPTGINPPTNDPAVAAKLIPLGPSAQNGWMATEDITLTNPVNGQVQKIPQGSVIQLQGSPYQRNTVPLIRNYEALRINFLNAQVGTPTATDLNGDFINDRVAVGEDYNTWVVLSPSTSLYEKLRFVWPEAGQSQPALINQLPKEYSEVGSSKFAWPVFDADGNFVKWFTIDKPYRSVPTNPYGNQPELGNGYNQINPYTGSALLSPWAYNGSVWHSPTQFNPNNPNQATHDLNNLIESYTTTTTAMSMNLVDSTVLASNQTLADLKFWLSQKDPYGRPLHTFHDGILSGAGPWNATYQVPGATPADPPVDKKVVNAYVNNQGELLVEYA